MSSVRGIRGAVRVKENTKEEMLSSTKKLLLKMLQENDVKVEDVVSVFLTATVDLDAEFPAYALREMGWRMVPVLCAQEMDVSHSMSRVRRILLHVNTSKSQEQIRHQYLGETKNLRPDLCGGKDDDNGDEK
ncbi:MAG: chorismate mutase [Candidatus Zixiibacteriota bacterium]